MLQPKFYNDVATSDGIEAAYQQLVSDLYQYNREQAVLDESRFYIMTVNHLGVPVIRPVELQSITNYIYFQEMYDNCEAIRPRSFHYLDDMMNLQMISIRRAGSHSDDQGSYTDIELLANGSVVGTLQLSDGR